MHLSIWCDLPSSLRLWMWVSILYPSYPNQSSSFLLPWSPNVRSPIYTLQLSIANPMCNYYTSMKEMEINGGEVFSGLLS